MADPDPTPTLPSSSTSSSKTKHIPPPLSEIPIYITNVHPVLVNNEIIWDIFYLTENSKELHCLRIFNIKLSFLVARFPTIRLDQFERLMKNYVKNLHTEIRTDLSDSSYFNLGRNREYMEIFSTSPSQLNEVYKSIFNDLSYFYKRIDPSKLTPDDKLFYENTETPFRFTSTTLSVSNSVYNLSTKYNIPLVGGARLNLSNLTQTFPSECLPTTIKQTHIKGLNAQFTKDWTYLTVNDNINRTLTRDEKVDFKCNMTMMAYDIETYNDDGDLSPIPEKNYIFCIGMGIFNLNDQKPEKRICIISKDLDNKHPTSLDGSRTLECKRGSKYSHIKYDIKYEYNPALEDDYTEYIICNNELELLQTFIRCIHEYKPQIITGFNSFGFDDNYVYMRMKLHKLHEQYLQEFTYYPIDELKGEFWFKQFMPELKQFDLKIDNEKRSDNTSIRSWLVLTVDVYKLMLKEDPKRFTQYGRGKLNDMLDVYDVKNPYTKQPLSKTGLTIAEMYRKWLANEDIYSIALYCCQDAWICGTLLIKRSKLADLIEMSGISNTTFADSLYRADGTRVANSILAYAYNEKFALMDTPFELRDKVGKDDNVVQFGGKKFDKRTIVGGAVRNVHAGRQWFIVALDYASMYPSSKEGSNLDSSSRISDDVIANPDFYGLNIVKKIDINDVYGNREIYYVKRKEK